MPQRKDTDDRLYVLDDAPPTASYIGLPYKVHGRSREDGLDCWGLVRLFYQEQFGVDLPAYVYTDDKQAQADAIAKAASAGALWVPVKRPAYGDVVVLRWFKLASHIGVMLDKDRFLHCQRHTGVVLERVSDARWLARHEGYYRHAGRLALL